MMFMMSMMSMRGHLLSDVPLGNDDDTEVDLVARAYVDAFTVGVVKIASWARVSWQNQEVACSLWIFGDVDVDADVQ
eukprot:CAMPEP_0198128988 /NCGR_PEP_ID=MMETSP1442-20131203/50617_1 /TAXON_ID= /ORGANISM="Craspedostauros australis, Strain CCMP3328" /LENGTH=76 /DNA_ID=CAMNT_0043789265 /DNA_START=135 /DNA_END=365 /DNA_ORIENTATION=+